MIINKKLILVLVSVPIFFSFKVCWADSPECRAVKAIAARDRNNPPDTFEGHRRKIESILIAQQNSRERKKHGCNLVSVDYRIAYTKEVTTSTRSWYGKVSESTGLEIESKHFFTAETGDMCPATKKPFVEYFGMGDAYSYAGAQDHPQPLWRMPCSGLSPIIEVQRVVWCCPNTECEYREPNKSLNIDKLEMLFAGIENEVAVVVSNMSPPPMACDLRFEVTDRRGISEQYTTLLGLSGYQLPIGWAPHIEWDWQKDRDGNGEDDGYEPISPNMGIFQPLDCDVLPRGLLYRGFHSQGYEMNRAFLDDSGGRVCGHVKACLFCTGGEDIAAGSGDKEGEGEPLPESNTPVDWERLERITH